MRSVNGNGDVSEACASNLIAQSKSNENQTHNNRVNSDSKKRRSFVAMLFAAGYAKRWAL